MKNKKWVNSVVLVLGLVVILAGIIFLLPKNEKSIYCVMEDATKENKMEIYYDFKDGEVYRYSIVNTNKLTDNINVDAYKEMIQKSNDKYKGATSKFWKDDNTYMTTEIYNLDLLTENEFKEITGMSLKDIKSKTRKDIIESIIPMGEDGSFKCN